MERSGSGAQWIDRRVYDEALRAPADSLSLSTAGATWSQRVRDIDKPAGPYGDVSFKATVVGHETVSTPAGTFDAVKIRYVYQLDDESLSNYPTQCEYVVWYAPSVASAVKEQRRAWSMTKGWSPARMPAENALHELTASTRAG